MNGILLVLHATPYKLRLPLELWQKIAKQPILAPYDIPPDTYHRHPPKVCRTCERIKSDFWRYLRLVKPRQTWLQLCSESMPAASLQGVVSLDFMCSWPHNKMMDVHIYNMPGTATITTTTLTTTPDGLLDGKPHNFYWHHGAARHMFVLCHIHSAMQQLLFWIRDMDNTNYNRRDDGMVTPRLIQLSQRPDTNTFFVSMVEMQHTNEPRSVVHQIRFRAPTQPNALYGAPCQVIYQHLGRDVACIDL